jgi:xanthine dehydrogenase accessory factor
VFDQFLSKAAELLGQQEPFAVAIVVQYTSPISGKPGYKAIIHSDGRVWGWVGGGCTQPVIVKEALRSLEDGRPRLVRISPAGPAAETPRYKDLVIDYTMTCHSGGAVEVYIEPVFSKPQILILGCSPVAENLARLGKAINYVVRVAAPRADQENFHGADEVQRTFDLSHIKITPQTYVVVSTQGDGDEEALEKALATGASYIAFVASKTKAAKVLEGLLERGQSALEGKRLRVPAGLDIKATSPEEIAVSILAEIIQVRGEKAAPVAAAAALELRAPAIDPICGMNVDITSARFKAEYRANTFYFCCAGCQRKFESEPARYADSIV